MSTLIKAAHLRQLTFSLLALFLVTLTACEDPGSVGSQFVSKSELVVDTVFLGDLIERQMDPFLGRLQRAAAGEFNDGLYGSIRAVSYFKPDISAPGDTLAVGPNALLRLRLRLYANDVYGDTTGRKEYHVYRATEQWRGTTIRKSSDIAYNEAELIGRFADTEIDTNGIISVILGGSYRTDFIDYLNADDEEILDQYLLEDHGLVIVPAGGTTQRINYLNFISTDLFIQQGTENDFAVPIRDWAFDFEQTGAGYTDNRIYPSNVDLYYQLDLSTVADQIRDKNMIRAEFILYEDTLSVENSLAENEKRSEGFELAMIVGPVPEPDFSIGFQPVNLNGFRLTNGTFVFNLTTALNNNLFANADISEIYLFLNSQQGLISFSSLYSGTADPALQPKILIYNLRSDE